MKKYSRICASIQLDAIEENFRQMRANIRDDAKMIAVIKADGYGHGAVQIAHLTEEYEYIWGFAVATAEEALELKKEGIQKPVLVLGPVFPEHYAPLIENGVRLPVFQSLAAKGLSEEAVRLKKDAVIHFVLDTGMTRIGFKDDAESIDEIVKIASLPGIQIEGMFTHFARADERDKSVTDSQFERYTAFRESLRKQGIGIPLCHCSNSAGIIDLPRMNLDLVRAGISIYGIYPSEEVDRTAVPLLPAMELKSHITYIKDVPAGTAISYGGTFVTDHDSRIATIPVGYADGYPRMLSNKGWVLIRGKKAPITGRVCMDQFMVDVTEIPGAEEFDEVTLLGKDGSECIYVEDLSRLCGRFPYEFVCDISKRVPRNYIKGGKVVEQKDYFSVL